MPRVVIAGDHLSAEIVLRDDERVSLDEAQLLLTAHGITVGVMPGALMSLGTMVGPATVRVAEGTPPLLGEDARIEYDFETSRQALKPEIKEDGRADFRNLGLIVNVQPGQVLARRIPPKPPKPGCTVMGRVIMPEFPKDVVLRPGPGTQLSYDGQSIVAAAAGSPSLQGGYVVVRPEYVIYGNVDLSTGNVAFDGDLRIVGNVALQMEVKASGNVIIGGIVEGARVVAGGDVDIYGGVRNQTFVQASGNVSARFVEGSVLVSSGSLEVMENLLHCDIRVAGAIDAGGTLFGGAIQVGAGGRARVLGSRMGTITELLMGQSAADVQEMHMVEGELQKTTATLVTISGKIRSLQQVAASPHATAATREELRKLLELAKMMHTKESQLSERRRQLAFSGSNQASRFEVTEAVHPGVSIRMGTAALAVNQPLPSGVIESVDGMIRFVPRG